MLIHREREAALEVLCGAKADGSASAFCSRSMAPTLGAWKAKRCSRVPPGYPCRQQEAEQHEATMHGPGSLPQVGGEEEANADDQKDGGGNASPDEDALLDGLTASGGGAVETAPEPAFAKKPS